MSFGINRFILLLFSYVKFFYYLFLDIFIKKTTPIPSVKKSLLIIKLDEIGDYIFFRNLLQEIRNSKRFRGFSITLCGNIAWQTLAEKLDKEFVNGFIWIDKKKLLNKFVYRSTILKHIRNTEYSIVINASYSRNFYLDDTVVKWTQTPNKIGFVTDLSNSFSWQKLISDRYYTELIDTESERFEFYKNQIFISKIIDERIMVKRPFIDTEHLKNKLTLNEDYIVFYMGGRRKYKRWAVKNFVTIAKALSEELIFKLVLVGSESDKLFSSKFLSFYNPIHIVDLTGSTDLIELISVLKNAKLVLSNDSAIAHISAIVSTSTFVLLNGTHYGRFFPYPREMGLEVKSFFPPEIVNKSEDNNYLRKRFKYRSTLDINTIEPVKIITKIFENVELKDIDT